MVVMMATRSNRRLKGINAGDEMITHLVLEIDSEHHIDLLTCSYSSISLFLVDSVAGIE